MILVIPAIEIDHALCREQIDALGADYLDPASRARLLRKENAKALHIQIDDEDAWCDNALGTIKKLREAIDIPAEVSLSHLPPDLAEIGKLIDSGIYRVILPLNADYESIGSLLRSYSPQKIVPSIPLATSSLGELAKLKELSVQRVALIRADDPAQATDWDALALLAAEAKRLAIRLTSLFGVYSFTELMKLDSFSPIVDSVVLGSALLHNLFPCQGIWREAEREAITLQGVESNLWRNPLEGIPHI